MKNLLILFLALAAAAPFHLDKTVHDFGIISVNDGPQSCTFTITNDSDSEPLTIFAAVATCGCTDVEWTRTDIAPGKTGKISATYTNDDGPYPFDKKINVYTSAQQKPIILHLKGEVRNGTGK